MECGDLSYSVQEYTICQMVSAAILARVGSILTYVGTVAEARCTIQSDKPPTIYLFVTSSWEIIEQLFCCYLQSPGNLNDVFKSDVSFPSLYSSDIIAVQSGSLRKFFLRDAPLNTKGPYRASEPRFNRLRVHLSSWRADHYESTHDECDTYGKRQPHYGVPCPVFHAGILPERAFESIQRAEKDNPVSDTPQRFPEAHSPAFSPRISSWASVTTLTNQLSAARLSADG